MADSLLKLTNVSFSFPGGKKILNDINLQLKRNDLVIIKGASGAGKSTFLKVLNRFCDAPEGTILFRGKELKKYSIDWIRSSIIYLPQLPLMIEGTVKDNLRFPFSFHCHRGKKFEPVKAGEWLDYFQLDVPMDHDALKLSVGQKQRIALIRAMLLDPEVLLLDEPGSSLDSNNKKLIEHRIEHLIDSSRVTVLMATHSDVSFTGTAYRVFHLEGGELIERMNN